MAYSLVGSAGAVSAGVLGAAVTPAWGTGESRTAGNLLICWVASSGVSRTPGTPSGWSVGVQNIGTTIGITVFYKIAAGSDTAPTIAAVSGATWQAVMLAEFSGNAASSPLDQSGSGTATSSPVVATAGGTDVGAGELVVFCVEAIMAPSAASVLTSTLNNGALAVNLGSNNGVNSTLHYELGYGITTGNSVADSNSTAITTGTVSTSAGALVSFKLPNTNTPGTGATTATLSGAATGVVGVVATASSTATLSGTAAGVVKLAGAGSSTATLMGSALSAIAGTASSTATLSGAATATLAATGTVTATLGGAATAAVGVVGTASTSATLTASAPGTFGATAAIAGTLTATAAGAFVIPSAGASTAVLSGSATGGLAASGATSATLSGAAAGVPFGAFGSALATLSGLAAAYWDKPDVQARLCIFLTPQVRDRPPYLPETGGQQLRLMRHFENRLRGVLVWLRNDGTYCVDTNCNYESAMTAPAACIIDDPVGPDWVPPAGSTEFQGLNDSNVNYPWNDKPGSTNSTIPGSFAYNVNWDRTTQDFILNPYMIRWWEGAAYNVITQADALALTAAGFGDCIFTPDRQVSLGSEPHGQGPYGSWAINK